MAIQIMKINKVGEPFSTGYLEDAFSQAILLSKPSCFPWLMTNYIDICFEDVLLSDNQPLRFFKPNLKNGRSWDVVNVSVQFFL